MDKIKIKGYERSIKDFLYFTYYDYATRKNEFATKSQRNFKDVDDLFLVVVDENGKLGCIDYNKKLVIPCKYDEIQLPEYGDIEEKFTLKKGDKKVTHKLANKYFKYENGICSIKGKSGTGVAYENRLVIPCEYSQIWTPYSGKNTGRFFICKKQEGDKWQVFDYAGCFIASYDEIEDLRFFW